MRRKHLLFVTYQNEQFDDGLSYAIHLAKTLGKDLSVLLVQERKGMVERLSDMIAASAFAEACEPTVAIEIMNEGRVTPEAAAERNTRVVQKCRMSGIDAAVNTSEMDLLTAIKESIRQTGGTEMVLLGPTVTGDGRLSARDLSRLVKTATMPVITIARQASAA